MKKKGFTYIEIAIAVSIFGLLMLYLAQMNHTSTSVLSLRRDRLRMNYIAQEELEKYKSTIKDHIDKIPYQDTTTYEGYIVNIDTPIDIGDGLYSINVEVEKSDDSSESAVLNDYLYCGSASSNSGGNDGGNTTPDDNLNGAINMEPMENYLNKANDQNGWDGLFYDSEGNIICKNQDKGNDKQTPIDASDITASSPWMENTYGKSINNKTNQGFAQVWYSNTNNPQSKPNYNIIVGEFLSSDKVNVDSDILNWFHKSNTNGSKQPFHLDDQFINYTPLVRNNMNQIYVVLFIASDVNTNISELPLNYTHITNGKSFNVSLIVIYSGVNGKNVSANGPLLMKSGVDVNSMDSGLKNCLNEIEQQYIIHN